MHPSTAPARIQPPARHRLPLMAWFTTCLSPPSLAPSPLDPPRHPLRATVARSACVLPGDGYERVDGRWREGLAVGDEVRSARVISHSQAVPSILPPSSSLRLSPPSTGLPPSSSFLSVVGRFVVLSFPFESMHARRRRNHPARSSIPPGGASSPDNADLDEYFDRTYHVAEQDGASVNVTFSGSAIAIYGSTGPDHADYKVQFDDAVIFPTQSAFASKTQFQQLLFQYDFSADNVADFLTFTDGNITTAATSTAAVATVTPPYLSSDTSSPSGSGLATPSAASDSNTSSSSSKAPVILAGLFGGILGLVLIFVGVWAFLRYLYYRRRRREHAFRLGAPPPNTPKSTAFSEAIPGRRRRGTGTTVHYHGGESVTSFALHNPFFSSRDPSTSQVNLEMSGASMASLNVGAGLSASGSRSGGFGSVFADSRGGYTAVSTRGPPPTLPLVATDAPPVPAKDGAPGGGGERKPGSPVKGPGVREFLTASPVLWAGAKHRGDADSLRTDFLQV
ncbi:uncharacterized protein B0H18DRAFT_1213150 [Fomitopsis serialis]|uniref:uncharacterized protein n=1 Tax=Fomitopsis serialis TaxID=139415 RepID=UPI002008D8AB|nr:uncharacterized protein B0H18DRAFT_1213150 [Neoantrodia serialis]KAH9921007.1 hypothetical protein B0H18DRAFT_1213150 [Neoantrodia serialis]